jgi:hypothetical protein
MADPKLRPGQIVQLRRDKRGFQGGPYEIIRTMPDEGVEPRYRVRETSTQTLREHVFDEHELGSMPSEPSIKSGPRRPPR